MGFLGFGKEEIGRVEVPGQGTLTLPAGKIELRYVENREGREYRGWRGPGNDLEVTVTPAAGGEPLEIRKRGVQGGAGFTIHRKLGTVETPAAGEYVLTASMTVDSEHHVPRVVARA